MTDCTTYSAPLTSIELTPAINVANSMHAVNSLRASYRQACEERDAAWRKYTSACDDWIDYKIDRAELEKAYSNGVHADQMASEIYTALQSALAEHLDLIECGCIMDQSCPICRAVAARVWTLDA